MTNPHLTVELREAAGDVFTPALIDEAARRIISFLADRPDGRTAVRIGGATGGMSGSVYQVLRGESSFGDIFVSDGTSGRRRPARIWRLDEYAERIDRDVLLGVDEPLVLCNACDRRMATLHAARPDEPLVIVVRRFPR